MSESQEGQPTQPGMESTDGGSRRQCYPRVQAIGQLGAKFNWMQVVSRSLSVLYELGALAFIAWLYNYWKSEPTTRVDVLFPSFFPVCPLEYPLARVNA